MNGIFVAGTDNLEATLSQMDRLTQDWTRRAARGECGWVCSDCCSSFPNGMPDKCDHGSQWCTDIIARDKIEAYNET